jgi:hypothetical protein
VKAASWAGSSDLRNVELDDVLNYRCLVVSLYSMLNLVQGSDEMKLINDDSLQTGYKAFI